MSQLTSLALVVGSLLCVVGVTWFINRPVKPAHKVAAGGADDHDAHPFTVFGHTPLFYLAVPVVLAATWYFGPRFFPTVNVWLKMGLVFMFLLFIWPPVWLKLQKVVAGVRGKHFHEHVAHGDDEQDTFGKILFWIAGTYTISIVVALTDHCINGTDCSVFQNFWSQLAAASGRWAFCPANWVFILVMAWHSRWTEQRFVGYTLFVIWLATGVPYAGGGWAWQPFYGFTLGGNTPPTWLLWWFPPTS